MTTEVVGLDCCEDVWASDTLVPGVGTIGAGTTVCGLGKIGAGTIVCGLGTTGAGADGTVLIARGVVVTGTTGAGTGVVVRRVVLGISRTVSVFLVVMTAVFVLVLRQDSVGRMVKAVGSEVLGRVVGVVIVMVVVV